MPGANMEKQPKGPTIVQRIRVLPRGQKILFWSAVAIVLYTVIGFLILPPIVKMVLEKKLPEVLHRQLTIQSIQLNPYTLSATIEGLNLHKKDGTANFVAFDRLFVNLQSSALFKRAVIVKAIVLSGLQIRLARNLDETYDFADLIAAPPEKKSTDEPAEPLLFSINNIELIGGNIEFDDRPKDTLHTITDLNFGIPSISNLPADIETFVRPAFEATVNGTKLALGGASRPFSDSRSTALEIKMSNINLLDYLAYVPNETELTLQSAFLDIDAKLFYEASADNTAKLSLTGLVGLNDIQVVDQQQNSYLQIPRLAFTMADANLLNKEVHLANLTIQSPSVAMSRQANGDILPLAFVVDASEKSPEADEEQEAKTSGAEVVTLTVDEILLENGRGKFVDYGPSRPATTTIDDLTVTVTDFSTAENSPGNITYGYRLNRTGTMKGQGTIGINPLSVALEVDWENIALKSFQPYVSDQVNIVIGNGVAFLRGKVEVSQNDQQEPSSCDQVTPLLSFKGDGGVDTLATLDSAAGEDLLKWDRLRISGIDFRSEPQSLNIQEIALKDIYTKLLISQDGRLNLATLKRTEGKGEAVGPERPADREKKPGPRIRVGTVSVKGGTVEFLDRKISPAYAAVLNDLQGSISGLSSLEKSRADLSLAATLNQHASLAIKGKINPLTQELFADLKVDFADIDLSPISPYTGKYIGRKVAKGKLNLNLEYMIDGRSLNAKNHVFLDQFTLGETVDSPDAANLPINLAIALLQNRAGEITLDIPVKGNLDDPEFSLGGVVVQVIFNLIAKAVTSPFALLGALIPDGEDLQYIEFEPGLYTVPDAQAEKFETFATILFERPALRVDIIGKVDPARDAKALEDMAFIKMIQAQKVVGKSGEKSKKGARPAIDGAAMTVSDAEFPEYLAMAYEAVLKDEDARREKESQTPGGVKVMKSFKKMFAKKPDPKPASEMEGFLRDKIRISNGDLRLLAIERANQVMNLLVEGREIAAERLFIVEPQISPLEGEEKGEGKPRVELIIK